MKKLLKSQKGMTLVELVVGMVMFAIAVGAIGSIMVPTLRVYAEANEFAESNNLVDTLANQILDDLSEATAVTTVGTTGLTFSINTHTINYSISGDGLLLRGVNAETPVEVYTEEFYKDKTVAFDPDQPPTFTNGVCTFTLEISGTISISRTYSVRPVAVPIT